MDKIIITRRIRVYGIVQGVGFRPTVSRHAMETGIRGTVSNKGPYVEIYAQGTEDQVDAFLTALRERPPKRAAILKIDVRDKGEMPSSRAKRPGARSSSHPTSPSATTASGSSSTKMTGVTSTPSSTAPPAGRG